MFNNKILCLYLHFQHHPANVTGWEAAVDCYQCVHYLMEYLSEWVSEFTGRPQFFRLGVFFLSDAVVSDTGVLQGSVLSPFLFKFYTADIQYSSEVLRLLCNWSTVCLEYRVLVDNFVERAEKEITCCWMLTRPGRLNMTAPVKAVAKNKTTHLQQHIECFLVGQLYSCLPLVSNN